MYNFFGINVFVDDPVEKIPVGFVREYHNWRWDEGGGDINYQPGNIKFAPSYVSAWNFDYYYKRLGQRWIEVSPCIQQGCNWLHGGTAWDDPVNGWMNANKPTDYTNAPFDKPESYKKKAEHLFQFAARYGSTIVEDSKLRLAAGQLRASGLNLVQYIENWNEPDGNWFPSLQKFTPIEYAAMASASYDGHEGKLGPGYGIKQADPNMKVVLGGLAHHDTGLDYVNRISNWCKYNRADKKLCLDVINVHIYGRNSTHGISPEEADFKGKIAKWVKWRDLFAPHCEVWVSEFGWDTNPNSVQAAPIIGDLSREETQARWIVRAFLELAAAKVDKAQVYMLRDVDPNSSTKYNSCGLTGPKWDWSPKPSWYYVNQLHSLLDNLSFEKELTLPNKEIAVYKFTGSYRTVYAVWLKTSSNKVIENCTIQLDPVQSNNLICIRSLSTTSDLDAHYSEDTSDTINLTITEKPIFIEVV